MNEQETNTLKEFVSFYKNIYDDITDLEKQIKEIDVRKKTLVSLITNKRNEEEAFLNTLKDKYGKEAIDINNIREIIS